MSFELQAGKSLQKGVRRVVRGQLEKALESLTGAGEGSPDEAVREVRKCFKRVRSVLRLVRPVIGEKTYRTENTVFRDAARPLTEVRDAKVLVETLDKLAEAERQSFDDTRGLLLANLDADRRRVLDEHDTFARVGDMVREALARVKGWTDFPNRWSSVGEGLEDTYRRATVGFELAIADRTAETLHEWRKQTKYLRYQLEILRPLHPQRLGELVDAADRIGELLGDAHDLAVLRQRLTGDPDRFGDQGGLLSLLDRRSADLERDAVQLGGQFFRVGPQRFTRRAKKYWKAWRDTNDSGQASQPPAPV